MAEDINISATESIWYTDVPRSVMKFGILGLVLMIVTFGGFGAWAFRAPLAAAVIAQGSFVATGRNKIVQHLEGGIINEITVREGDFVRKGQLLLRLDKTASSANERELELRQVRLEATEQRILAEYRRDSALVFSDALNARRDDYEIASILDGQALAFRVSQSSLQNNLTLLERNIEALGIRRVGYATQLKAYEMQRELLTEDLESKEELFKAGLVRKSEVTALKRAKIEAVGQVGRLQAEVDEIEQIKRKYQIQVEKVLGDHSQATLDELQTVQSELESIREKARKAHNVSQRSDVVAPVSGTVVRLYYHTAGGVVESGKAIAEILPADQPLIVEVQIARMDIDNVKRGQSATVRLTALNQRTTPILDGKVIYVSADAVTDQNNGTTRDVYVTRVSLSPEQLRRVGDFTPTPGMPAQIMIQTKTRTFAEYLAKPVVDSMSRAFREQ
ncbi:HlyD family type I secretion periplasmic adaptor subunit [Roseovarius sp. ZX-A-9]|uniref:HlyD family type I secretion periplasmic adaptor subunit n=1 Tax=Roseovarius sp. ZX-A-9 TaxID=3014783 RepID=UPI00232EB036|nr:HlyD family type I secretion periplasmic adaptor subunit [Roseovarius sp. ZX-A-9]